MREAIHSEGRKTNSSQRTNSKCVLSRFSRILATCSSNDSGQFWNLYSQHGERAIGLCGSISAW
jgi:hypothetical protein